MSGVCSVRLRWSRQSNGIGVSIVGCPVEREPVVITAPPAFGPLRVFCESDQIQASRSSRARHRHLLRAVKPQAEPDQHQRRVKVAVQGGVEVQYIEATLDDIALANRLALTVLGHSLDELPLRPGGFTVSVRPATYRRGLRAEAHHARR